jgi:ribose transport system permease protein
MTRPAVRALVPLLLVLLLGCVFHASGAFFQWENHRSVLRAISVQGILACGMTVVIIAGGIDLSVGSVLGLAAVAFALTTMPLGWPAALAISAVLGAGAALGALSGALVARYRIQAFVVTLAMMAFARGLAKFLSGGQKVTTYSGGRSVELPAAFRALDTTVAGGSIAVVTIVFAVTLLVTWIVLERLELGRWLYAVGGNLEAARLCGVPVRATLIASYALSGLCAAVAGICQAAQETHGDPETGLGYELDAIAMVVLGGTHLSGGRGGVGLTLIGVLTLGYLQKVLSLNAFSSEARLMLTGVILVAAVLFQRAADAQERVRRPE